MSEVDIAAPTAAAQRHEVIAYHLKFTKFHAETIDATKRLFKAWPNRDKRVEAMKVWTERVSRAYKMDPPRLLVAPEASFAQSVLDRVGGMYNRHTHTMELARPSITTLMHEFRHAMQARVCRESLVGDPEKDARGWSLSLYHRVRPETFKRLVLAGKILYMNKESLGEETDGVEGVEAAA